MKKLREKLKRHLDKRARDRADGGAQLRANRQTWTLLLAAGLSLAGNGCVSNLQRSYVEANMARHEAVMADVKAGLYKADARSLSTLDKWKRDNDKAKEVLVAEGKWAE